MHACDYSTKITLYSEIFLIIASYSYTLHGEMVIVYATIATLSTYMCVY